MKSELKIAIIHDWLPLYGGAERVLEQILQVFPDADVFSIIDLIPKGEREFIRNKAVTTSFLQRNRWIRNHYRLFLPLMPLAIEQFDLTRYDLVVSSSYAVAKGVITGPGQMHVCYCHSPMRYAWDLQHRYLTELHLTKGPLSWVVRYCLHSLRIWDAQTQQRVDHFLANSEFVRSRIRKYYGRDAIVVHPPVNTEEFTLCTEKEDYYLTVSRMVPYKMVGLIVDAFARMPHLQLRVIGEGPEFQSIRRRAPGNVQMLGHQPMEELNEQMQKAKGFVFAAEEDFGIVLLEAQACGTPVIAYGRGGALETVVPDETGILFPEQSLDSLCDAVETFESRSQLFDPLAIRAHAMRFSIERFRTQFFRTVASIWRQEGRDENLLTAAACLNPEESEKREWTGDYATNLPVTRPPQTGSEVGWQAEWRPQTP